jgi:hypothetical protein
VPLLENFVYVNGVAEAEGVATGQGRSGEINAPMSN